MLFLGAEAHYILNAGPVIPAAIEDHDFSRRREMLHVALHVHLTLFAIRRRWQGCDAENTGTHALGDRTDGSTFAGGVTSLEHDDRAQALELDPILKLAQFRLQSTKLL